MESGRISTDLLFAYMALQNGLLSRDDFVLAMNSWLQDKSTPIKDVIRDRGWLDDESYQVIEQLMDVHLRAHQGQLEESLQAVANSILHDAELHEVSSLVLAESDVDVSPPADPPSDQESRSTEKSEAMTIAPRAEGTENSEAMTIAPAGNDEEMRTRSTIALGQPSSLDGRFKVLRTHAKGGLGQISIAMDNELNREVALKEILADHLHSEETKDRFFREAQITGRLEHPCIVPVYGMGNQADGSPYYVMRFIRGKELKNAIDQFHDNYPPDRFIGKRRVEFIQLLRQFNDVCNAIGYAHSRGIIHRDIKPANVLLGKYNETFVVDWGLAKPIGELESAPTEGGINLTSISDPDSSHTQMHSTLGTPGYMSPEQADGRLDELGPPSDVYSLGATLYYLLTRKSSVSGSDLMEITDRVRTGNFPPPRHLNKHIPAVLEAICLKAMALEPEDRYHTPQHMAADIESWIADEPVSVYPESLTQRFGRWLRRHRSWALATAASLVIIASISIVAAISINRAKNEESLQRTLAEKSERLAVIARDLAEKRRVEALDNFRQARNAVDTSLTGISEVLKHYPGVQRMRQGLLEKVAADYEQFASQKSDDLEIQLERGRAYLRLGDARRILNQLPEAEHAYQQARQVFTDLKKAQPGNIEPERELATSQIKLAILYQLQEDLDQSSQLFQVTVQQLRDLGGKWPEDASLQKSLAIALGNTANLHYEMAKIGESEGLAVESLALFRTLQRANPRDSSLAVNMGNALNLAGLIKYERGEVDQAAKDFQQGVEQFDRLLETESQNPDYLQSRAALLISLASTMRSLGNISSEETAYKQALESYELLVVVVPDIPAFKEALAITLVDLGQLQFQVDDLESATASFSRATTIYKELLARSPLPSITEGLATSTQMLGRCYLSRAELAPARTHVSNSVYLFNELVKQYQVIDFVQRLSIARRQLADVEVAEGQLETAEKLLDESLEETAQLIDLVEVNHAYRSDRASLLARKGEILTKLDRPDEALACWQEAVEQWEQVLQREPFAEKQFLLARLIIHHPSLQNAETLVRALELAGSCVEQVPTNARYQNLLSHAQLLLDKLGDADQSLAAARQARQHKSGLDDVVAALIAGARENKPEAEKNILAARNWLKDVQPGNSRMQWLLEQLFPESP